MSADLESDRAVPPRVGPTMGCFVDACTGDTWPDEDWLIFDTPVGSYEILLCQGHYEQYVEALRGDEALGAELAALRGPLSAVAAVELCMTHPVVHGAPSATAKG